MRCALRIPRSSTISFTSHDLRAHGYPQPEPRLLPSDPCTSPRGGDVVSHFVTLLSPEGARYPRLSTADSTDSAVALLSQEPLVRTECLAGKVPRRLLLALHGLGASPIAHTSPIHTQPRFRCIFSLLRTLQFLERPSTGTLFLPRTSSASGTLGGATCPSTSPARTF